MTDPRRRSPLGDNTPLAAPDGALALAETPFLGKLILRAAPAAAAAAAGLDAPPEANTAAPIAGATMIWLGPDEWMFVTEPDAEADLAQRLKAALSNARFQLVVVSDYYTAIDVDGGCAWMALSKLSPLDLHPRAFGAGQTAGTVLAKAQATIWRRADAAGHPRFRLFVRWSMADYVWRLLAESGLEYGLGV